MRRRKTWEGHDPSHLNNNDQMKQAWERIIHRGACLETLQLLRHNLLKWDSHMARKTYRIELKIDFNEEANHEVMIGIAKQYARDLLGSAMLLQDGRKPAVSLITDDSFHGVDEIDLLDEGNTLHT